MAKLDGHELDGHEYYVHYVTGPDLRETYILPHNESRDANRRSPLHQNNFFRVSLASYDSYSDHVAGSDSTSSLKLRDSIEKKTMLARLK